MREILSLVMILSLIIVIFRIPVEAPLKKVVKATTMLVLDGVDAVREGASEHAKTTGQK